MKKSKLLGLINSIEGDPDILLWNGYVEDWMNISGLVKADLVKSSFKEYCNRVKFEKRRDLRNWDYELSEADIKDCRKRHRKIPWEFNEWVTQEDIDKGYYNVKPVVLISAKSRGIDSWDRIGNISY